MRIASNISNIAGKRHWLRFRLRTLLILAALVAVVLAAFNAQTRAQRIAKEVEALGGECGIKQRGPNWVRDWFGGSVGPFDSISSVDFNSSKYNFSKLFPLRTSEELVSRRR